MNVHEYQAKELLRRYKVPLLAGKVAHTVEEAVNNAEEISAQTGAKVWVVTPERLESSV